ncbi:MAG: hypothetical protein AB1679_16625 [Actinomycetota bacterium]|jgi:hypothetical protein
MIRQRLFGHMTRAVVALATLVTMVVGVPAALVAAVGWPLPRSLPRLNDVAAALGGQSIDDGFLVKALAVICWLAWAQFVACIAAELVGWRHGRAPRAVPFASALQPLVAQLVVTAALLVHVTPRSLSPAPVLVATAPIVHVHEPNPSPVPEATGPVVAALETSTAPTPSYVVKPRDDLWTLAERHLGDGRRWRELFDLNRERPQTHGGALRHPNLVRPGWTLRFPADAVGLSPATPSPGGVDAAVMPATAAPTAERAAAPQTGAEAPPSDRCPDPAPGGTPATIAAPDTPPAGQPTDPRGVAEAASPQPAAGTQHETPGATKEPTGSRAPVGVLGASLMAAGLVVTLDRMRRAQQRRRPRHRAVRMPSADAVPTEVAVRRAATTSPAGRLDLALRAFAGCAARRQGDDPPSVSAVQVGPEGIEILLNQAIHAEPGPFTVSAGGQVWTLPSGVADSDLDEHAGDIGAPLPALVSVGQHGDSAVLIDLESTACTAFIGDEDAARAAFRALALEVATSLWADTLDVVLVADNTEPYQTLERIRLASTLTEILPDIEASAAALSDALAGVSAPTTVAARLGATAADGWIPTVVLCEDPAADPDALPQLLALAGSGARGLAVVVLGDVVEAGRTLRYHDGLVDVTPPGVRLTVTGPTPKQIGDIEEILTVAADRNGADPAPNDTDPMGYVQRSDAVVVNAPFVEPDFDILVRLLGPVEIEGAKQPIDRRKAVELVVYLATHPKGLNDERLKTALWPDDRAPQSSFNTTVTRARSRLGTAGDGSHHLPHVVATGGIYRVGSRVTTDVVLLERHLVAARAAAPEAALRILRSGLELVRGAPLAGARQGYEWAYAEGLIARIETLVGEAAHHLAQLALEAHDPDLAQWAARQGLLASPGDEVLFRDRMLACDLAGNPAGVEAVMDELVAAAEALEPYDTLHPETVALYERLSHRRRRTG